MASSRSLGVTVGIVLALAATAAASVVFSGVGCEREQDGAVYTVSLGGRTFHLELALDDQTRFRGLSERTHIERDGGMLFVFPRPAVQQFVMRDCPIPIDIVYLDGAGRVVAMHEMTPEEPRRPGESDAAYEQRLKRYSSGYAAQFVIEIAGGTLPGLRLSEGDRVELDTNGLKRRAR